MKRSETWDTAFARGLKAVRERLAKSQAALAEEMKGVGYDWHQSTVYKAENESRKVTVGEAAAIADILNVSIEDLLVWGDGKRNYNDTFVWTAADNFIGTLLKMEELGEQADRERIALKDAIAAYDSFGQPMAALTRNGEPSTAAALFGVAVDVDIHRRFVEGLHALYKHEQFAQVSAGTQGVTGLGTPEWLDQDGDD